MQLIKFDPLRDIQTIEDEIDTMLRDGWNWTPEVLPLSTLDMYEENNMLVSELALPQFKKEDIKVTIDSSGIEVAATHSDKEESKKSAGRRYYRRESSQNYWRRISLPAEAKWDSSEAEFKDGILSIKVPLDQSKSQKLLDIK